MTMTQRTDPAQPATTTQPATTQPADTTRSARRRRRPARRYLVVAVLAVVAALVGGVGAYLQAASPSAKDLIAADPPPALFSAAAVAPTERSVRAESARARTLMARWWAAHGHTRDDPAFTAWLEQVLPPPPAPAARAAEVARVATLAPRRTPSGVAAATWLETHGKKDVWKLFAHDQAELLTSKQAKARKADVKAMLKLTKTVADTLGTRYQQSAPYVLRPSLRPDHTVTKGQVCPCSYPSRHAAAGAAARTYLGGLAPDRLSQYEAMEAQIDWSRVYMAGHVPSDITAGALLGDLVGTYYLGTHA